MTLKVRQLSKAIDGIPVLSDVSFEMHPRSIIGLVGRNGAGKTSLMRLIAGEMMADSGEIILDDMSRETVFYLDTLANWLTGYNAKSVVGVLTIFYPQFDESQFMTILASQNLAIDKTISTFSKGQKALVYLAAGIASQASYLLFDEPLDGLDIFVKDYFKKMLLEMIEAGRSVMIATHNLAELDSLADRTFLIKNAHVVEQTCDSDIVKIQFVYEAASLPTNLREVATILEKRGRVYVALISEALIPAIFTDTTTYRFVEILPVTTEDIFRKELG